MAITKAPKRLTTQRQDEESRAAQFIAGAPDAKGGASVPAVDEPQNKRPITITFDPVLLAQLDTAAKRMGISRSAAFAVAVSKWLGIDHA